MTTPLYLILDDIGNGNRDLIAPATSRDEAITHWQRYYEETDLPERMFEIDPTGQPGPLAWNGSDVGGGLVELN